MCCKNNPARFQVRSAEILHFSGFGCGTLWWQLSELGDIFFAQHCRCGECGRPFLFLFLFSLLVTFRWINTKRAESSWGTADVWMRCFRLIGHKNRQTLGELECRSGRGGIFNQSHLLPLPFPLLAFSFSWSPPSFSPSPERGEKQGISGVFEFSSVVRAMGAAHKWRPPLFMARADLETISKTAKLESDSS